ncbi:MAG: type IV secretory system conjugative DNA transfer family protein [Intestinimonas sp.]
MTSDGPFQRTAGAAFAILWTPHTPKFMLGALLIYGFSVALYCSTRENRRPGEEHGSAKWGSPKLLDRKYRDKAPFQNTILTRNVRMGLNGKVHRRNLLQIVIGGSGAGKTRFFCKPNLMQANCSFLVTDCIGKRCGPWLRCSWKKAMLSRRLTSLTPTTPTPSTRSHT